MVEVAEDNKQKRKKGKKGEKKELGEKVSMLGLNSRPPILHYH